MKAHDDFDICVLYGSYLLKANRLNVQCAIVQSIKASFVMYRSKII